MPARLIKPDHHRQIVSLDNQEGFEPEPYVPKTQYGTRLHAPSVPRCKRKERKAASDINYMLDPSYSPSSSYSSGSSSNTMAYCDEDGFLHDPDYRMFAVLPTNKRSRTKSDASRWDAGDDEEEEDWERREFDRYPRRISRSEQIARFQYGAGAIPPPPSPTRSTYSTLEKSSSAPPSYRTYRSPRPSFDSYRSYEEDVFEEEEFELEVEAVQPEVEKSKEVYGKRDNRFVSFSAIVLKPEADSSRPFSPSRGDALRRQWQSLALSVTLGVFRTKRDLRQRFMH
jgi:hypothetical protein